MPPSPNNYTIMVNTDSKVSQQVLETGKGRDPLLTACSRQLWYLAAKHHTDIKIVHKSGSKLILAEALSRSNSQALKIKAENMCSELNLVRIKINHTKDILLDI